MGMDVLIRGQDTSARFALDHIGVLTSSFMQDDHLHYGENDEVCSQGKMSI